MTCIARYSPKLMQLLSAQGKEDALLFCKKGKFDDSNKIWTRKEMPRSRWRAATWALFQPDAPGLLLFPVRAFSRLLGCLAPYGNLGRSQAYVARGIASRVSDGVDLARAPSGAFRAQQERSHIGSERDRSATDSLNVIHVVVVAVAVAVIPLVAGNRNQCNRWTCVTAVTCFDSCSDVDEFVVRRPEVIRGQGNPQGGRGRVSNGHVR